MNDISLIMFICLITPLSMMMFVFKDGNRKILTFLLVGIVSCLISSYADEFVFQEYNLERYYLTINITPIIEELLKAIPIILFVFIKHPKQKELLECSIALGIGFATLENFCIMYAAGPSISITFAVFRGIGTGLMHGVCSLMVGYALSYVNTNKTIVLSGSVAALSTAIIFHSVYNILVQSDYYLIGVLLPMICYIPLIIVLNNKKKKGEII